LKPFDRPDRLQKTESPPLLRNSSGEGSNTLEPPEARPKLPAVLFIAVGILFKRT